ncbi:MAG TPA: 4Fe-4S binding protein [Bacteroidota bacterium]|nr:4Fe-4S binding protein [Bacteroidota bacterium]
MKRIVVMSGKGGTGKTTFTAALAAIAPLPIVLADCDVDAANLHLLLRPVAAQQQRFLAGALPVFDSRSCSHCGMCASACVFEAITLRHGQYAVDAAACEGCGICARVCPDGCISMTQRLTGHTIEAVSRFGQPMVYAQLCVGQENSGKLVTRVRQLTDERARSEGVDFVLVDGPPGLGCPAIAAMSGVDALLLLAEAGAAGAHDLARMIELRARFGMPAACIVNKADLDAVSRAGILERCEREEIPVLAEFPWSPLFPESLRQGRTLTEMPEAPFRASLDFIWTSLLNHGVTS